MSNAVESPASPGIASRTRDSISRVINDANVAIALVAALIGAGWYLKSQFEQVVKQITVASEQAGKQITQVREQVSRLSDKVDRLDESVNRMDKKLDETSARITKLEETVTDLRLKFVALEVRFSETDRRRDSR